MPHRRVQVNLPAERFDECANLFLSAMKKARFEMGYTPDEALVVLAYSVGAYMKIFGWPLDCRLVEQGYEGKKFPALSAEVLKTEREFEKPRN